jgi:hypothetical protein
MSSPIFIHSMFRAGSTYLFSVFRRAEEQYRCYYEPLHERVAWAAKDVSRLGLESSEALKLRHPQLDKPYFEELKDSWHFWKDAILPDMVYGGYFSEDAQSAGVPFYRALLGAAGPRPVFCDCRTSGRIGTLKRELGGQHIFLWRNPWDQWWSYQLDDYFETANQIILHAQPLPKALANLARTRVIGGGNGEGYSELRDEYLSRPLAFSDRYTLFYLLWCLALKEGLDYADYRLNIDTLCRGDGTAAVVEEDLARLGIDGLSFADAQCPVSVYSPEEQAQFENLENHVHGQLIESGWTEDELNEVLAERELHRPKRMAPEPNRVSKQFARQRQLTQNLMMARSEQATQHTEFARQQSTEIMRLDSLRAGAEENFERASTELADARQDLEASNAELELKNSELELKNSELELLGVELIQSQARLGRMTELSGALNHEVEQLKGMYAEVLRSWSWRLTLPLRWLGMAGLVLTGRRPFRKSVVQIISGILVRFPRFSRSMRRLLSLVPPLYNRVIALLDGPVEASPVLGPAGLNHRARNIHARLCERLGLKVEDL